MELDATQALPLTDLDDSDEFSEPLTEKSLVAHLEVNAHNEFPKTLFPVYKGDNLIGRADHCAIVIPLNSLSKEHAMISVKDGQHLIHDMNSRNKTKRSKRNLTPDVRYELRTGDKLTFGDVHAIYNIDETADDTDEVCSNASESILTHGPDTAVMVRYEPDTSGEDIILPTQVANLQSNIHDEATQAFPSDSPDHAAVSETLGYLPDSGSETEDEGEVQQTSAGVKNKPTLEKISDNTKKKTVQSTYRPCDRDDDDLFQQATQAFPAYNHDDVTSIPDTQHVADTQTFQVVQNVSTEAETQAYTMDIDATQTGISPRASRHNSSDICPDSQAEDSIDEDAPTQTFKPRDEEPDLSRRGIGLVPTLDEELSEESHHYTDSVPFSKKVATEAETQPVGDMENAETQAIGEVETQAVGDVSETETQAVGDVSEAETQAVGDVSEAETQAVGDVSEAETQAVEDISEAETQAVGDVSEAETQAVGDLSEAETQAVGDLSEAETQAVGDDPFDDAVSSPLDVSSENISEAPTLAVNDISEARTQAVLDAEEETQQVFEQGDDSDVTEDEAETPTLMLNESLPGDRTQVEEPCTPTLNVKFVAPLKRPNRLSSIGFGEEETQLFEDNDPSIAALNAIKTPSLMTHVQSKIAKANQELSDSCDDTVKKKENRKSVGFCSEVATQVIDEVYYQDDSDDTDDESLLPPAGASIYEQPTQLMSTSLDCEAATQGTDTSVDLEGPTQVLEPEIDNFVDLEGPTQLVHDESMSEAETQAVDTSVDLEGPTQALSDSVDLEGPTQALNDSVDLEGPTQALNDSVDLEGPTQALNDTVDLEGPTQALNDSIDLEAPTQALNDTVDLEGPTQALNNSVDLEGPTQALSDSVDLEGPTQALNDSVDPEGPTQALNDSVDLEGPTQALNDSVDLEGPTQALNDTVDLEGPTQMINDSVDLEGPTQMMDISVDLEGSTHTVKSPEPSEAATQIAVSPVALKGKTKKLNMVTTGDSSSETEDESNDPPAFESVVRNKVDAPAGKPAQLSSRGTLKRTAPNAESMTSDEEDMSLLAPPSKLSTSPSMSPRSKTVVRPDLSTVNKSSACQDANEVNDSVDNSVVIVGVTEPICVDTPSPVRPARVTRGRRKLQQPEKPTSKLAEMENAKPGTSTDVITEDDTCTQAYSDRDTPPIDEILASLDADSLEIVSGAPGMVRIPSMLNREPEKSALSSPEKRKAAVNTIAKKVAFDIQSSSSNSSSINSINEMPDICASKLVTKKGKGIGKQSTKNKAKARNSREVGNTDVNSDLCATNQSSVGTRHSTRRSTQGKSQVKTATTMNLITEEPVSSQSVKSTDRKARATTRGALLNAAQEIESQASVKVKHKKEVIEKEKNAPIKSVPALRISRRLKVKDEQRDDDSQPYAYEMKEDEPKVNILEVDKEEVNNEGPKEKIEDVPIVRISRRHKQPEERKDNDSQPYEYQVQSELEKENGTRRSNRKNAGHISEKDAETFDFSSAKVVPGKSTNGKGKASKKIVSQEAEPVPVKATGSRTRRNGKQPDEAVEEKLPTRGRRKGNMKDSQSSGTSSSSKNIEAPGSQADADVFQAGTKRDGKRHRQTDSQLVKEISSQESQESSQSGAVKGRGRRRKTLHSSEPEMPEDTVETNILQPEEDPDFIDLLNSAKRSTTKPEPKNGKSTKISGARSAKSDVKPHPEPATRGKNRATREVDEQDERHETALVKGGRKITSRISRSKKSEPVEVKVTKNPEPVTEIKDTEAASQKSNGRVNRSKKKIEAVTVDLPEVPDLKQKSKRSTRSQNEEQDQPQPENSQTGKQTRSSRRSQPIAHKSKQNVEVGLEPLEEESSQPKRSTKNKPEPKATGTRGKKRSSDNTDNVQAGCSQSKKRHRSATVVHPPVGNTSRSPRKDIPLSPPDVANIAGMNLSQLSCSPSLRKRNTQNVHVMFTGLVDEEAEKYVTNLGGELTTSILTCTHLITDRIRRTVKLMCGVARGIKVVSLDWIEKSHNAHKFLDASKFLIQDQEHEKQFNFCLRTTLSSAAKSGILCGYRIHVTANVKPEPLSMKDIIESAGGQYISDMEDAVIPSASDDQTVIVTCNDDEALCREALNAGMLVMSAEFILTGILQHKISHTKFLLFNNARGSKRVSKSKQSRR